MNSNELNKKIMKIVQCTIEPLVTEYLQQHPEYFTDCVSGDGKICQHEITLSYQPDKIKDIATVRPTVFIRLGNSGRCHELVCFDHSPESMYSTFTVDRLTVSDQKVPNV